MVVDRELIVKCPDITASVYENRAKICGVNGVMQALNLTSLDIIEVINKKIQSWKPISSILYFPTL